MRQSLLLATATATLTGRDLMDTEQVLQGW